jgi:hypothetical protein
MKTIDFLRVLKKMIREEVQQAVRTELRVLTEGKTITSNKTSINKPTNRTRTTPLVTLEEDFTPVGMSNLTSTGNNMLDSLLNETAHTMQNPSEIDPELPYTSDDTSVFVKDYSAVLKRSQEIR